MAIVDLSIGRICNYFVILCLFFYYCQAFSVIHNDINAIDGLSRGAGIPDCVLKQFRCQNGRCVQYNWLCDGDKDCEDGSDESDLVCKRNCTVSEFQCDSGLCIPREWACDKEKNCADGSDEDKEYCENFDKCDDGQFYCNQGHCIPGNWKCDGKKDCPNGLDEANCHVTCKPDQFTCGDGSCISSEYVCDADEDCLDGRDEKNCSVAVCGDKDFLCPKENKCIPKAWRCDGHAECEDRADEEGCVYDTQKNFHSEECSLTEWLCMDKSTCIPIIWMCDDQKDCQDGSDEASALCSNLTCRADQFQCKNKQCIPGSKHCDNEYDCIDNSDEEDCDDHKPTCDKDEFDCGEGMCLPMANVCDNHADCPGNEDEPADLCGKNECSINKGGCSQGCVDDVIGYHCTCHPGFHLINNHTCEDIDECRDAGSCSHTCINTVGSFKCECNDGYVKEPTDPTSCKALHSGSLIFTKRQDIRKYTLDRHELTPIVDDSKAAAAMDFVFKTGTIFWMETANNTIFKAPIDAGFHKTIVIGDNIKKSDGLAIDWIYDHIYWTDTGKNTIELANFDGTMRKVLISTGMDEPRSIAVNPLEGWLFWSDWGTDAPKIEKAGMDGSHRSTIVSHNIRWPNGITLDLVRNRIYWVDAKLNLLSSANYDGSGRKSILRSKDFLHLPHSLTIFEDLVYWADWDKQTIFKADKFDGSGVEALFPGKMVHNPMVVHIFHPYKQPQGINHCITLNDRCSHLCLPAPMINDRSPKISCTCPDGMRLAEDSTICVEDEPKTQQPEVNRIKNTNVEERIIDIEFKPDDESGYVMMVFVVVVSVAVSFCAGVLFVIYRHYIHKNVTSMNFENFVYRKTTTTDDSYGRKTSTATSIYKPPSTIQVTDDSRVPLNSPQTTELV